MVEIKDITAKTINDIFMLFSKNSLHPSLEKESFKTTPMVLCCSSVDSAQFLNSMPYILIFKVFILFFFFFYKKMKVLSA